MTPQSSPRFRFESKFAKPRMFSKFFIWPLLIQGSHCELFNAKVSAAKKADSFRNVALQRIGLCSHMEKFGLVILYHSVLSVFH